MRVLLYGPQVDTEDKVENHHTDVDSEIQKGRLMDRQWGKYTWTNCGKKTTQSLERNSFIRKKEVQMNLNISNELHSHTYLERERERDKRFVETKINFETYTEGG